MAAFPPAWVSPPIFLPIPSQRDGRQAGGKAGGAGPMGWHVLVSSKARRPGPTGIDTANPSDLTPALAAFAWRSTGPHDSNLHPTSHRRDRTSRSTRGGCLCTIYNRRRSTGSGDRDFFHKHPTSAFLPAFREAPFRLPAVSGPRSLPACPTCDLEPRVSPLPWPVPARSCAWDFTIQRAR